MAARSRARTRLLIPRTISMACRFCSTLPRAPIASREFSSRGSHTSRQTAHRDGITCWKTLMASPRAARLWWCSTVSPHTSPHRPGNRAPRLSSRPFRYDAPFTSQRHEYVQDSRPSALEARPCRRIPQAKLVGQDNERLLFDWRELHDHTVISLRVLFYE